MSRYKFQNHTGRPKGARNRLQNTFVTALAEDFEEHGAGIIRIVRCEEPATYLKIITAVLPKEMIFENATSDLDDDQIDELIEAIKGRLLEVRKEKPMLTVNAVESVTNGSGH